MSENYPIRLLRVSIKSVEADRSNAVIVRGAFDGIEETPYIQPLISGLTILQEWAERMYPSHTDWRVMTDSVILWNPVEEVDA